MFASLAKLVWGAFEYTNIGNRSNKQATFSGPKKSRKVKKFAVRCFGFSDYSTTADPQERSTWRSGVRSSMRAASQLPARGPTDLDDAPAPAC